ncbi:MAG: MBL fold metallo-hydrolase [Pseudomonadales bacterium]|jgi:beta-lactamase superfamily II metal-dependent hydrolase|nr:MBL fold metallo-hydrolase [Pseudomonadales bacterium]
MFLGKSIGRPRRRRKNPLLALFFLIILVAAGFYGYISVSDMEEPYLALVEHSNNEYAREIIYEEYDFDGDLVIHFIDVGQGDATLIKTSAGSVLIDGGDRHMGERMVAYLRDVGVSEITYVIATHPHADHIGGLVDVLNEFSIGQIIMPPVAHTTVTFERFLDAIEDNDILVKEPSPGVSFNLGEVEFTIIAPNSTGYQNLNDYSVSVRVVFGETSFVFTGDAERISEMEMIEAGHVLSADVLRVGHHGSRTSTTQEFFDAVDPSIVVISVGADNRYGHPHSEVTDRLEAAAVRIYRTDQHGTIIMTSDGTYINVRTEN